MSDLIDELLHMAADGAGKARPLAVAEVIRRGNRRRARTIGQRSLGGLSVLGIGAAVVMTGVLHPVHGAAGNPASSSANTATTLTETAQSSAGRLNVQVEYRDAAHGKIQPLSITIAGKVKAAKKRAGISIAFGPVVSFGSAQSPGCRPRRMVAVFGFVRVSNNGGFAESLSRRQIISIIHGDLCGNEALRVGVTNDQQPTDAGLDNVLTAGLVLTR